MGAAMMLLLAVAGHVLALPGDLPADDRVAQLQRDRDLIRDLVEGGVKLAAEADPLKRADHCNRLADGLAREIKKAVATRDALRAAQLSEQMQLLLVRGVAGNLHVARASLEPNSPREPEFLRLGIEVAGVAKTIEDEVGNDPTLEPAKMQPTLDAVAKGRAEVEQAIKGKGKNKGGHGKKGKS
jgi:hypothetical protein